MSDGRVIGRMGTLLAAIALLSACDQPADEGPAPAGEVLEGTVSDAMLPIDRVRSEAPLEDPAAFAESRTDGAGAAAAGPSEAGQERGPGNDAAGDEPEPAPAEEAADAASAEPSAAE